MRLRQNAAHIIMAQAAMRSWTVNITKESFRTVGLWPIEYRFIKDVKQMHGKVLREEKIMS